MRTQVVATEDRDVAFEAAFKELSEAVKLDKHDLDNQLVEHAELFRQVCDYLALYTARRDMAKRTADEAEAEVDQTIRAEAADAGEKVTEAAVKQRLILDRSVKQHRDKVAELTLTVSRLAGLKDAYIERRHAFGKLADLYGNQYWSEHSGVARKAVQADRRERIRETITRNNRERERVS